jgi:SAM-dependent methyltransferase
VLENQMGPNALWLTEWLCQKMDLKPGMRVLYMGCGKALSSIFLAREFGVQVWANDLWISADENWQRIQKAGLENQVYPIHAEAHNLPYASDFFDAIVSSDSYQYYGTDDLYFRYIRRLVRRGGQIGIVVPGLMKEITVPVPQHLTRPRQSGGSFWYEDCWSFHTVDWWRNHWARSGSVNVETADTLEEGWRWWLKFEKACVEAGTNAFSSEVETLEADAGEYIGFVRIVASRKFDYDMEDDGRINV